MKSKEPEFKSPAPRHKPNIDMSTCNRSVGGGRSRWIPGAPWTVSRSNTVRASDLMRDRVLKTKVKNNRGMQRASSSALHMPMHTPHTHHAARGKEQHLDTDKTDTRSDLDQVTVNSGISSCHAKEGNFQLFSFSRKIYMTRPSLNIKCNHWRFLWTK